MSLRVTPFFLARSVPCGYGWAARLQSCTAVTLPDRDYAARLR